MLSKQIRKYALMTLALSAVIGFFVLVWPTPKEALATDSSFTALVDWNNLGMDDDGIVLHVITRAYWSGPVLDDVEMIYESSQGDISRWKVAFLPMPNSVVWWVEVENLNQHEWLVDPMLDDDNVVFGGVNDLDNPIICTQ